MKLFILLLKSIVSALILLLLSMPVVLVILAIEDQALVPELSTLSANQISDIQQLLIDQDPRLLISMENQTLQLSESELNALLNYFIVSIPQLSRTSSHVEILDGISILDFSIRIPETAFGRFVNLSMRFRQAGDLIDVAEIGIGSVNIPAFLFHSTLDVSRRYLENSANYRLFSTLVSIVESVTLMEGHVDLSLNWQTENIADIRNQAQQLFISEEEKSRLLFYHSRIVEISNTFPSTQNRVSLNDFLRPLFKTALENSNNGADPIAENRALFIAMTIYLTELRLEHLIGSSELSYPSPRSLKVNIGTRSDLPQHILSSAAIASSANANVADILSIYKEVHDSRYRTGFSFSDITANQVGASLGSLASQTEVQAKRLQQLMSASVSETDYMPLVAGFDGLTEQEFITLYESRDSAVYQQRLREIETAIASRPLFRAFGANIEFINNQGSSD